ncbi:glucose-6-phosphate dehydrogenase assembly protein OpcA [Spirulina subsalsa FACHB-351]|uniref:Glucose-6-phosphate dehydrogenase assembly protein OpcA n=1 Tax=Spirulina subsalsa FACHB-351 TaxID=234711 RepID=A0ABT3L450_9CYAN|nr:glucose-6-phosphate dehydrogenase assembly protein OpcA [Spirulina subsalsa]MCW6036227.1 glucose-6-phosphate dehydrogenase assembly protein OpcA [Spirulina subsalsa FACHB-351]
MVPTSPPLVSLQAPKDVSIDEIEASLRDIWQNYSSGEAGLAATRATTFSFLIYEPDGTQLLLAALGFYTGPIDGISGGRTEAAIKAAQKAYDFEVTGKSDEAFIKRLKAEFEQLTVLDKQTPDNLRAALQYAPDLDGAGVADAIASSNPCRIITLCPTTGADEGVTAQVSAYCPIQKRSSSTLICCEYINLRGTAEALERIGGIISALMIPDLPKFIWWKATPQSDYGLFQRLVKNCDTIIVDSSSFSHAEADLHCIGSLIDQGLPIADLNWRRIAPWQELAAEAFDPPERRLQIWEVDQVVIDYEKGNPSQALLYLGWLASRLHWKPIAYEHEGGDYDIRRIRFVGKEQRHISVELAGIPTADWGDIPGDLISLKLDSTNCEADCCTVLCSETTGCMRMESGGGAQSCRINQVTSLSDQKTEQLLGQQLQRWGKDMLYEESMVLTYEMMQLMAR